MVATGVRSTADPADERKDWKHSRTCALREDLLTQKAERNNNLALSKHAQTHIWQTH